MVLFNLGITIFLAISYLTYQDSYGEEGAWIVFLVLASIAFIFEIIFTAVGYTEQVSDLESVQKFKATEGIYKEKAESLTAQFARYLANDYPQHEKEIFAKISPEKVGVYLVQYPELKAAETVTALVEEINELQSTVYQQKVNAEYCLKNIRCRPRNFWIYFTPMIPRT